HTRSDRDWSSDVCSSDLFIANGAPEDRLGIRHQGTAAGQIGVNGSEISYGGTPIGTATGGESGSSPLVVTFNAEATPAAAQSVRSEERRVGKECRSWCET